MAHVAPLRILLWLPLFSTACVLSGGGSVQRATPEQNFFDWTHVQFEPEVHASRRRRLADRIGDTSNVFLAPARDGFSGGETFRQLDDFLYFSGLELPNSILAVRGGDAHTVIFAPSTDARFHNSSRVNDFPGRPLAADDEIARRSGVDEVRDYRELAAQVAAWVDAGVTLHVHAPRSGTGPRATDFIAEITPEEMLCMHLGRTHPAAKIADAGDSVAALRLVKDVHEIELIRKACAVTCAGIALAAGHVRPGVDERTLEAELEAAFKRGGAARLAFDSIIKSGPNSLWPWRILAAHYDRRNRTLLAGELVIFDVGCEVEHYASDVGRTFPVSGRFSDSQRRRMELITAASDAVLAAIRPGVTFADLRGVLLSKIPLDERRHMQASLFFGHHIGLAVGDPSLEDAPLEAGMIFTVEPWYYNHTEELAVFLEDVVLVTPEGCEVLTESLPRTVPELEALTGRSQSSMR